MQRFLLMKKAAIDLFAFYDHLLQIIDNKAKDNAFNYYLYVSKK